MDIRLSLRYACFVERGSGCRDHGLLISASMDRCRLILYVVLWSVVVGTQHRQCPVGFYGSSCQHKCPMTCNDQQCNIDKHGRTVCTHGCVDGYSGPACGIPCPGNCQVCERVNGSCINCKDTFHGTNCTLTCEELCQGFRCDTDQTCSKTTCLDGRYGQNCSKKCYPRYLTCARSDGDCTACKYGFHGSFCFLPCPQCGFTDNRTNQTCKDGCTRTPCTNIKHGDSGIGSMAVGTQHRQCPVGFYGSSCQHTCPRTCYNKQCNIDEFGRTSCIDGCVDGYRGTSCRIPCPGNCQVCERVSGSCINCKDTFHGTNCTLTCEELCQGFRCDTDKTCSKSTCLDGRYGQNCSNKCYTRYLTCARSTGNCTACRYGYYGQNCEHDCPQCGFKRGSMDQICKDGCQTTPCTDTTPGDAENTVPVPLFHVVLVLTSVFALILLLCLLPSKITKKTAGDKEVQQQMLKVDAHSKSIIGTTASGDDGHEMSTEIQRDDSIREAVV